MNSKNLLGVAALTLISVCVSACGGGDTSQDGDAPTATVTVTTTQTPTPAPTTSPTAEASAEPQEDAALGTALETDFGTIEVLQLTEDVHTDDEVKKGLGDTRWSALLVRTCVADAHTGDPVKLSWYPWTLEDAGGGGYIAVDATGPRYPSPVYPQLGDRTTRQGQCAKGWITFDTSGSKGGFAAAVYERDGLPAPLVWQLERPTSNPSAPAPSSAAAASIEMADACTQFAAGWIGNTTKRAYENDAALAQRLVDAGGADVESAFEPIATIAASAARTLGTFDYVDDEEAFDNAIVKLNGQCEQVGAPIFTD